MIATKIAKIEATMIFKLRIKSKKGSVRKIHSKRDASLREVSESAFAGKADPGKSLVHLLRILPYCSRRITVVFAYASSVPDRARES
jgi:hypothetical protein